jgi:hypothetical protein
MEAPERPDRGTVEVTTLTARTSDRAYWLSRPPAERWEALELLRQIAYGYDPATARLQRVLEIVELKTR